MRLGAAPVNFDPATLASRPRAWQHDERLQPLAAENPGPPAPGGSWELARRLMRGYEFADPSIVRAYYDPSRPLLGRTMLLEMRFHGLRFRAGCRVAAVYERTEALDGAEVRVWGWSYQTLAGHLEQGEMHWQVLKWPATGQVAFRIRAWHRQAPDPPPVIRLGYRLLGRRQQLRFYDSTCERMRQLTDAARATGPRPEAVRDVAAQATADHTAPGDLTHEQLARNVGPKHTGGSRQPQQRDQG